MVKTGAIEELVSLLEPKVRSRPSPSEFEMAYQIRVAIDRIRFPIKATERSAKERSELQHANLELLEALDRLQSAEQCFQARSGSTQRDRGLTYEWSHR
jgi:hypothetical protein